MEVINRILQMAGIQPRVSDGSEGRPRHGNYGEYGVMNCQMEYKEIADRARFYLGSTPAAGVTVPIFSNTTQQFVLFNPPGSGRKAIIDRATLGYVSGTMVAGHFCYAINTLITSPVTGTAALVMPGKLTAGAAAVAGNVCQLFTAATVVAMTYLRPIGWSQVVQPATGVNAPWLLMDEVRGRIVVYPGQALAIAANVAAAVVAALGLDWGEEDLPSTT